VTDLFAAAARLDPTAVGDVIPPGVRRDVEDAPAAYKDGDDVVIELGPWMPRAPARHLLPSLALLTPREYAVRFEVCGRRGASWTAWIATAPLGGDGFAPMPAVADGLTAEIDEIHAAPAVDAVRLRFRLRGERTAFDRTAWLATLSAWDGELPVSDGPRAAAVRLGVPQRTQIVEPEAIRLRICSPTSLGMAMQYLGRSVPTLTLADAVFHAPTDRYGVWPAAVRAAALHGIPGYLLRFPDWTTAAWCLARGLPIVASIRFGAGELTGSPLSDTTGHLVVITGLDGDDVLVNDPAAPTVAAVARRYRRSEFTRAWLERSGVGYVFFRSEGALPPSDDRK
jgi:hypothetical protein